MSIKTQIRLEQVTGSVASISGVSQGSVDPSIADMKELMAYYAQALTNIHGSTDFGAQLPGQISHSSRDVILQQLGSSNMIQLDAGGKLLLEADSSDFDAALVDVAGGIRLDADGGQLHLVQRTRSGDDAIRLQAESGGVTVDAEDGDVRLNASKAFEIVGSDTGADGENLIGVGDKLYIRRQSATAAELNSAGWDFAPDASFQSTVYVVDSTGAAEASQGALRVNGGAGIGQNLHVGNELVVTGAKMELIHNNAALEFAEDTHRIVADFSNNSFQVESGMKLALTGTSGVEIHSDGSSAGVSLQADAAGIYMSGSSGITFQTDGAHAGFNQGVDLATYGEGPTWETAFTGKSIFGAMLDLNSKIASNEATRFEEALTADVSEVSGEYPVQVIFVDGDNSSMTLSEWTDLKKNQLDVYVNGQLLRSGSTDSPGDDKEDYVLDASTVRTIKFQFPILADDVVVAIER